jgi:hypothetical protein
MSALPPWADVVFRVVLLVLPGLALATPALLMAWVRSPLARGVGDAIDQPVAFDHRHHVRDDGIDCLYCHVDAERGPYAGVPDAALCMGCHGQVWNESPELSRVRASFREGRPIRWQRVTQVADFVFFDHSAHVRRGVGCESCHGRVDLMPEAWRQESMTMSFCIDCHRDPDPLLRPVDRVTEMGLAPDRVRGARVREALHLAPPTDCTGCHR